MERKYRALTRCILFKMFLNQRKSSGHILTNAENKKSKTVRYKENCTNTGIFLIEILGKNSVPSNLHNLFNSLILADKVKGSPFKMKNNITSSLRIKS